MPEEERRKKQVEYFVLTRNPEKDENGKEKTWSTQARIALDQPLDF